MTLAALAKALDKLDEQTSCEGTYRAPERIALALPDGDVAAVDDAGFVKWLVEHGEIAPFGAAKQTKVDKNVRHATRLKARGKVDVAGFDPAAVLDEIERALSPRTHLAATLTDVIVYPEGGKFARHKDTPRSADLVGTLVVGLPVAHRGGQFHVEDGTGTKVIDWSGTPEPSTVRWVALFSDVDHEIKPVTSGARVTLVYSLARTDRPRDDQNSAAKYAALRKAADGLATHSPFPVMIACSRHAIIDPEQALQPIAALRGADRDVADVLVEAGFDVTVRACLAASPALGERTQAPPRFPQRDYLYSIARLKKPLSDKQIAKFDDVLTFSAEADFEGEEVEDMGNMTLAPYIVDQIPLAEQWVLRKSAVATIIHEADMFSDDGYFGNEAYEALIYSLAALEVTKSKRKVAPAAKAKKR